MNAFQEFFQTYPVLAQLWQQLCIAVPLAALAGLTGLGVLSVTARIQGVTRRRTSYDKCARQLAMLGMGLGWLLLIASRVWLYVAPVKVNPNSLQSFLLEGSWMLLSIAVLLSSVYFLAWKPLKNLPVVHAVLGVLAALQGLLTLLVALGTARLLAAAALPEAGSLALRELFLPAWPSPLWAAMVGILPYILGMAGALAALWLPLRRKQEDYGRDHYNTMVPWCAAWARNAWIVLWLVVLAVTALRIWVQWQNGVFAQAQALQEGAWLLLWLLPVLLWGMVCRSVAPLRHKLSLLIALFIAVGFGLPFYEAVVGINLPQP